jgi:hypothetical protein
LTAPPTDSEQKITLPASPSCRLRAEAVGPYRPEAKKTKFLSEEPTSLRFFPSPLPARRASRSESRRHRAGGLSLLLFKISAPSAFRLRRSRSGASAVNEPHSDLARQVAKRSRSNFGTQLQEWAFDGENASLVHHKRLTMRPFTQDRKSRPEVRHGESVLRRIRRQRSTRFSAELCAESMRLESK